MYLDVNERIHLRLLELTDAEELYVLTDNNRTHLREWLPWVDATKSLEDTKLFIKQCLQGYAAKTGVQTAVWYQGKIVGCLGVHGMDCNNKKAAIGYWLSAEYQGLGIMTQSCQAVVDHIFSEWGLNRIEIRAAEHNIRSRAIPERLGFKQEGIVRQAEWLYDHYVDHVVYGMLTEEWTQQQQECACSL